MLLCIISEVKKDWVGDLEPIFYIKLLKNLHIIMVENGLIYNIF